jgi:hypothetical protein
VRVRACPLLPNASPGACVHVRAPYRPSWRLGRALVRPLCRCLYVWCLAWC